MGRQQTQVATGTMLRFTLFAVACLFNRRPYILVNANADSTAASPSRTYSVFHNVGAGGGQPFVRRGSIELAADGANSWKASFIDDADAGSLNAKFMDGFNDLLTRQGGGFYQIKVVDDTTETWVMASVSACALRRANFREEVTLKIGASGSLMAVGYSPIISPLASKVCRPLETEEDASITFRTNVKFNLASPGMTVPAVLPSLKPYHGLGFFPKHIRDAAAAQAGGGSKTVTDEEGETSIPFVDDEEGQNAQQNRGFLARYWYIIVPVAIMALTGGPPPEEEGGQAAGGQEARGGGNAAPAAAAPAQGQGGGTRRRGKRD